MLIPIILSLLLLITQAYDKWVPSQHLDDWYNDYDKCIVYSNSSGSVDDLIKSCEKNVGSSASIPPTRCRAGNTWPSRSAYCSTTDLPFSQRANFRNTLEGYDNPNDQPLRRFFSKMQKRNGMVLLIGDSVMQQFFSAMACELEREKVWTNPAKFTNTDEVQYVRVNNEFTSPSTATTSSRMSSTKSKPSTTVVSATTTSTNAITTTIKPVPIKFLPIYHFVNSRWDRIANASMHMLQKNINEIIPKHDSIVIILNMGLHYVDNPVPHFSRKDYQAQMTMCLKYLHNIAMNYPNKQIQVFWRETTAQHFPTPNGYWPGAKFANTIKFGCQPIKDPSPAADWRNRDIESIILRHNLFKIKIIRYYNLTLPLWSEHPNGQLKDCTHFCWTPMLYQPIFHLMDQHVQ